jgi:transcriptional regulator with XRE-family HTH domain
MARDKEKWRAEARGLATAIRHTRRAANLSQQALAERAHISIGALRSIEQQVSVDPGIFEIAALASAMNVSIDDLIGGEVTA